MVERTRLDHLAYKFYDNPHYWWVIATANSIGGRMYVEPKYSVANTYEYP